MKRVEDKAEPCDVDLCNDYLRISGDEAIRCQLPTGHIGEHSASWEWEDAESVERLPAKRKGKR